MYRKKKKKTKNAVYFPFLQFYESSSNNTRRVANLNPIITVVKQIFTFAFQIPPSNLSRFVSTVNPAWQVAKLKISRAKRRISTEGSNCNGQGSSVTENSGS